METKLPDGCKLVPLGPIEDSRGILTEVYRQEWVETDIRVQWNLVRSKAGTLRGVHTHLDRTDYLIILEGEMWLGLRDLRRSAETFGKSCLLKITPETNVAAYIATGVAHGFYFPKPSVTLYGLSNYWTMEDEMGCHPEDSDLGIEWPVGNRLLSGRDAQAGSLADMQALYDQWENGRER